MDVVNVVGGELDATCGHGNCERKGVYRMRGRCRNCQWSGIVIVTRGHEAPRDAECKRCGCRTVACSEWYG